jgi:hypothetical protein
MPRVVRVRDLVTIQCLQLKVEDGLPTKTKTSGNKRNPNEDKELTTKSLPIVVDILYWLESSAI